MDIFRNISIKNKLILIIMFTTVVIIGINAVVDTIDDISKYKEDLVNNTITNAKLIGEYSIAPLSFKDTLVAFDVIKKIEAIPWISTGCIYDENNNLFASYQKERDEDLPVTINSKTEYKFEEGYLKTFYPIEYNEVEYGTVYLKASTDELNNKINRQIVFSIIIFLGMLAISFLIASKLQNTISKPILDLAQATTEIALEKKYSQRALGERSDEIGILYNGFNNMLERINAHEQERNRTEELLRQSEEKYRCIVDTSIEGIWSLNKDFITTFVNTQMAEILGYSCEEMHGQPISKFIFAEDLPDHYINMENRKRGIAENYERRFCRKDGNTVWLTVSATPIMDGDQQFNGSFGMFADITERKLTEEKIFRSEQRLRLHAEQSPLGFLEWDENFCASEWNAACEKIFGFSREEAIGRHAKELILPPEVHELVDVIYQSLQSQTGGQHSINKNITKNRQIIFCEWFNTTLVNKEGKAIGVASICSDITERLQIEEERKERIKFIENLDRINQTFHGTNDFDTIMNDALDLVLSIFECDRAFLLYPCDPSSSTWTVPIVSCKPEYPGISDFNLEIPMDIDVARTFRILLESDSPVQFGPGTPNPLPLVLSEQFDIKGFMSMAIYPKVGLPWQFGIHQCSYARIWTANEEQLFQEIGRRLADSMTGLLSYRNLEESEERFRTLITQAADAVFLHNFEGKILDVNQRACESLGYNRNELLTMNVADIDVEVESKNHKENYWETLTLNTPVTLEGIHRRKNGSTFPVEVRLGILKLGSEKLMLALARDITDRKLAEELLRQINRKLRAISDCNQSLLRAEDEKTLLDEVCNIICNEAGYKMAWVGYAENDDAKTIRPVARAGGDNGYLKEVKLSWSNETELGQYPAGIAIRTGKIVTVQDFETDSLFSTWSKSALLLGYHSCIALPLKDESNNAYGALLIYSAEVNNITPDEVELMEELANDLAFGINSLRTRNERDKFIMALKTSEERYRMILENSPVSIWEEDFSDVKKLFDELEKKGITDFETYINKHPEILQKCAEKTKILDLNKAALDLYKANKKEELLTNLTSTFTPEYFETFKQELTHLWNGGTEMVRDAVVKTISGDSRYVTIYFSVCPGYENTLGKILVSIVDITDRRMAEAELRRVIHAVEQSPLSVVMTDIEGDIVYVNPKFSEISGYGKKDIYGKNPRILKSGEMKDEDYKKMWETISNGKEWHGEFHNKKKNGELYWEAASISAVKDKNGEITHYVAIKEDITEKKRIQKALENSEELFRTLIMAVPDIIIRTDTNEKILYANESVLRLYTDQPVDEIIGKNLLDFISSKDKQRAIENSKKIFHNQLGLREYRLMFEEGKEIDCEVNSEVLRDSVGQPQGIVYIFRDISERRKAERELDKYRLHLEELIADRTIELEKVNVLLQEEVDKQKEAEQKVRAALEKEKQVSELKSQFISLASHEFRTPLTTVLSSTELLTRYNKEEYPAEYSQLIERIKKSVKYLTGLMDDVLTISRADTGKLTFSPSQVNIENVCSEILEDIKLSFTPNHNLNYLSNFKDKIIIIDEKLFRFIVGNLMSNAIKYSPDGGEITFSIKTEKKNLSFEISDNGIGIPEKDKPYLFEPFHRGANINDIRGTGLGMSIVKRSVDLHEGAITFESIVSKGTKFSVSLPYKKEEGEK